MMIFILGYKYLGVKGQLGLPMGWMSLVNNIGNLHRVFKATPRHVVVTEGPCETLANHEKVTKR